MTAEKLLERVRELSDTLQADVAIAEIYYACQQWASENKKSLYGLHKKTVNQKRKQETW